MALRNYVLETLNFCFCANFLLSILISKVAQLFKFTSCMQLRSTSRRLFPPSAPPIIYPTEETMATDLTNITQKIAGLIIPVPPPIKSTTDLIKLFIPAFHAPRFKPKPELPKSLLSAP